MIPETRLMPPAAREEHVHAVGGSFRVLRAGDTRPGTPILLVHGGGSDNAAISWYRLIEPLSEDRPVIAPDLPGFGYTEGVTVSTTAAEMADQLRELIEVQGIDRVVVGGVSMGGEVALQFALRYPDACAALVPVAAGGLIARYKNPLAHRLAWIFAQLPDAILFPMANAANRFVKRVINGMVRDPSTLPPAVVEEFAREARRPRSTHAYARYNQATLGPRTMRNNMLPVVAEISTPALFFHGANDPLVDPRGSQEAVRRMPNARLVLVRECGHWAQLEVHEHFLGEVREFLRELES